jgi:hypothetical protein
MLRRWAAMLLVIEVICAAEKAPGSASAPGADQGSGVFRECPHLS